MDLITMEAIFTWLAPRTGLTNTEMAHLSLTCTNGCEFQLHTPYMLGSLLGFRQSAHTLPLHHHIL